MGPFSHSRTGSVLGAALLCVGVQASVAQAQGLPGLGSPQQQQGSGRLLVEARELVYDNDNNRVSAVGDVELYYNGRTLQADRVIYDRRTGRVHAEGNARLTDTNGAVVTAERFELTDDFRTGFIDSLRVTQTTRDRAGQVNTYFTAPRAERVDGEQTTFERGTYTACEPCKDKPEKPPFWQVKAAKIIHNSQERMIYFEDASLEFLGVPIAYVPYFSTPDQTVKRKTGFLPPRYIYAEALGYGVSAPFFWALAPNYDLTITPTILSRQGLLGQVEWRHRLLSGAYSIRATGIFQQDPARFLLPPNGAGDREFRGSIETKGLFHINERWRWGWDITQMTDKWFHTNYVLRGTTPENNFFKEEISTLYLRGQGARSWFDVRGYYFTGLSSADWQSQLPIVHPVLDYNKRMDGPQPLGGEVSIDVNITSLSRENTQFQGAPAWNRTSVIPGLYPFGSPYDTCIVFQKDVCLVRGLAGNYSRFSAQATWRRKFVDDFGQVITPFAYLRADGFYNAPDLTGYQNAQLPNFIRGEDEFYGRVTPAIGVDYRYPFVAHTNFGTHVVEPIAQIVARPNETRIGRQINEDAQSLIFDDTNLFEWDKFSGWDRAEGGVRANLGAQYSITGPNGFYANALFGQSFQLAGRNSFAPGDILNVGRDSGLENSRSDYVARQQIKPNDRFSFMTRQRFDEDDFELKRFEAIASLNFAPLLPISGTIGYGRFEAQPEIGYDRRREGLSVGARWDITSNWYATGGVSFDLDRNIGLLGQQIAGIDRWEPTATSIGIGYRDECTIFEIGYQFGNRPEAWQNGEKDRQQLLLVKLELRTLGQANLRQNIGGQIADGGVRAP